MNASKLPVVDEKNSEQSPVFPNVNDEVLLKYLLERIKTSAQAYYFADALNDWGMELNQIEFDKTKKNAPNWRLSPPRTTLEELLNDIFDQGSNLEPEDKQNKEIFEVVVSKAEEFLPLLEKECKKPREDLLKLKFILEQIRRFVLLLEDLNSIHRSRKMEQAMGKIETYLKTLNQVIIQKAMTKDPSVSRMFNTPPRTLGKPGATPPGGKGASPAKRA